METTNVLVLSGGPSTERNVSLESGRMVCHHLDSERFHVVPVEISRNGTWLRAGERDQLDPESNETEEAPSYSQTPQGRVSSEVGKSIDRVLLGEEIEVVFIAMHGSYGEDGTIQGLLEAFGVRYTGSGVCASALAMDKARSRHMMMQHHLPVPRWMTFDRNAWNARRQQFLDAIESKLGLPCVVKPNSQGSSIGVQIVQDSARLESAIQEALQLSPRVVIDQFLKGTEITCGVLEMPDENCAPRGLPVVEIVTKDPFFDYQAKYDAQLTEEIVPARIDPAVAEAASKEALKAHQALGCRGFSRTDMILVDDTPYVLELNTIPGLTPVSLFPKAAAAAGIEFPRMLEMLIDTALMNPSR